MFNFEKVSSVGREEIWIFLVNVAGGGGGVGERERERGGGHQYTREGENWAFQES